ncbi:MAG: ferritin family protein [Thermodesulfobacteriota bacterium]|nr:ferritin family protein [Thermodesulfobacteriota bacterium]
MIYFSGSEIIEAAIQIEKNGYTFYRSLAESMDQKDIKDLFFHLATEEEKHIKNFEALCDSFKGYKPNNSDEEEYYAYIKSLSDRNVFTKKEGIDEIVKNVKGKEDALSMAMGFEKDSIIFFIEIRDLVKKSDRIAIDALIHQEREHLRKLIHVV